MIILELYISGVLIGMSLVLLGTGNLGLIRTGITKGSLPAFIFSLGCATGDMIYASLSVLGVALILEASFVFSNYFMDWWNYNALLSIISII